MFKGLFGQHFQDKWNGNSDQVGLRDKLGVLGSGISQLYAGQAPDIQPAWQAVEDRRAKRKLGETMQNPDLLAGFTPQQRSMLAAMPPEMAQSLIMESVFAPPPDPMSAIDLEKAQIELAQMKNPPPEPGYATLSAEDVAMLGLPPGSYQKGPNGEIKQIGGGGTSMTVDMGGGSPDLGKLSTDYGYLTNPDGSIQRDPMTGLAISAPVPGSPAAKEAEAAKVKTNLSADKTSATSDVVLGKLDELDNLLKGSSMMSPATGLGAETLAGIGGTRAADTKATVDTIAANMAFDSLAQMRAASPTGGALGAISDTEINLLSSTLASLKQTQSPEQFARNVKQLREIYTTIKAKADAYPGADQYGFGGGTTGDAGAVPTGVTPEEWAAMTPEEKAAFQ